MKSMRNLLLTLMSVRSIMAVCYGDNDCDALWPKATCRNGRCVCPPDTIRWDILFFNFLFFARCTGNIVYRDVFIRLSICSCDSFNL